MRSKQGMEPYPKNIYKLKAKDKAVFCFPAEEWVLPKKPLFVKELDLFVTVMFLEETPAVLSLGNLCEDHGYTDHLTSGQKPHLTKKGKKIDCNMSNYVPFVVPGLSTSSSISSSKTVNISPEIIARLHRTDQRQMGLLKEQCAE